jgi:hypothetical protein
MKKTILIFTCPAILIISLFVFSNYVAIPCLIVDAQDNCCSPPIDYIQSAKLPANATVLVTLQDAFTVTERQAIKDAFTDWNDNKLNNCTNITFDGFGTASTQPNLTSGTFWVQIASNATNGSSAGETFTNSVGYARTFLNPHNIRSTAGNPINLLPYIRGLMRHEIGHSFRLANASSCPSQSSTVMYSPAGVNSIITTCDNTAISQVYCPAPTPTPTPEPTPTPSQGGGSECIPRTHCSTELRPETDVAQDSSLRFEDPCCYESPIVIDILGNGFSMTNMADGVNFDFNGDGIPHRISWTSANSDDAWLALDRNNNGLIDNAAELFGDFTPQPIPIQGEERNGFLALRVYDKPADGGNNDNKIDAGDNIFTRLLLWQDSNHNGISETDELKSFSELGLAEIELDYKESKRTDEHGNQFRYRAKVKDVKGAKVKRWAWDVYLVQQP